MCTYFRLVICQDIYLQVEQLAEDLQVELLAEDLHVFQDSTMHDSLTFACQMPTCCCYRCRARVPYHIDMIVYAVCVCDTAHWWIYTESKQDIHLQISY